MPEIDTAETRLEALRTLIPPERFRQLAAWFDMDDEFKVTMFPETWPKRGCETQDDLRKFADLLEGTAPAASAGDQEPPLPDGIFGRVELPGYRQHTGWITEETRFGQQMAVVRDWDAREVALAALGPGCQVVVLPTPRKRPDPPQALPAGRYDAVGNFQWSGGSDDDDPDDDDYR